MAITLRQQDPIELVSNTGGLAAVDPITQQRTLASGSSQFGRGWESAGLNEEASALMFESNRAASSGDLLRAASLKQQGLDRMAQAQQWAPRVSRLSDVNGIEDAADWAGGALGNIRSSVRPALGGVVGAGLGAVAGLPFGPGGIATGAGWGARLGAGYAGYDTMTDANVAQSMMDPTIAATRTPDEIASVGRKAGAVQGVLESIVPGGLAKAGVGLASGAARKQIAEQGLKKYLGKQIGVNAAEEFATEFAQNPVGDVAQNYLAGRELGDIDWKEALNAGAAGAVAGGGMGAAGGAISAGYAGIGAGAEKTVEVADKVKSGEIITDGIYAAGKAKPKLEELFDRVVNPTGTRDAIIDGLNDSALTTDNKIELVSHLKGRYDRGDIKDQWVADEYESYLKNKDVDALAQNLKKHQSLSKRSEMNTRFAGDDGSKKSMMRAKGQNDFGNEIDVGNQRVVGDDGTLIQGVERNTGSDSALPTTTHGLTRDGQIAEANAARRAVENDTESQSGLSGIRVNDMEFTNPDANVPRRAASQIANNESIKMLAAHARKNFADIQADLQDENHRLGVERMFRTIVNDETDKEVFRTMMADRFGENAPKKIEQAFKYAIDEKLIADTPETKAKMVAAQAAVKKAHVEKTAIRDNVLNAMPASLRKGWSPENVDELVSLLKGFAKNGTSKQEEAVLMKVFGHADEAPAAVKSRIAQAMSLFEEPQGKSVLAGENAEEIDGEDGEDSPSERMSEGDPRGDVQRSVLEGVRFSGNDGGDTAFQVMYPTGRQRFNETLQKLGKGARAVGLWDKIKEQNDDLSERRQAEDAALLKHVPAYKGRKSLDGLDEEERRNSLTKLNETHKFIRHDTGEGSDTQEKPLATEFDPALINKSQKDGGLRANRMDAHKPGYLIIRRNKTAERKGTVTDDVFGGAEDSGEEYTTTSTALQRLSYDTANAEGSENAEGAHGKLQHLMQGLASLIVADPSFTPQIGFVAKKGDEVTWLEPGEGLPGEFSLGGGHTVMQAVKEQREALYKETEKSNPLAVRFAGNREEMVAELTRLTGEFRKYVDEAVERYKEGKDDPKPWGIASAEISALDRLEEMYGLNKLAKKIGMDPYEAGAGTEPPTVAKEYSTHIRRIMSSGIHGTVRAKVYQHLRNQYEGNIEDFGGLDEATYVKSAKVIDGERLLNIKKARRNLEKAGTEEDVDLDTNQSIDEADLTELGDLKIKEAEILTKAASLTALKRQEQTDKVKGLIKRLEALPDTVPATMKGRIKALQKQIGKDAFVPGEAKDALQTGIRREDPAGDTPIQRGGLNNKMVKRFGEIKAEVAKLHAEGKKPSKKLVAEYKQVIANMYSGEGAAQGLGTDAQFAGYGGGSNKVGKDIGGVATTPIKSLTPSKAGLEALDKVETAKDWIVQVLMVKGVPHLMSVVKGLSGAQTDVLENALTGLTSKHETPGRVWTSRAKRETKATDTVLVETTHQGGLADLSPAKLEKLYPGVDGAELKAKLVNAAKLIAQVGESDESKVLPAGDTGAQRSAKRSEGAGSGAEDSKTARAAAATGDSKAGVGKAGVAAQGAKEGGVKSNAQTPFSGAHLGTLPMYYKMPVDGVRADLRAKYPNGTTTAQMMKDGVRTATTRQQFGMVGDTFTVDGQKYRITAIEKIDLKTQAGKDKWSQREGWDAGFAMKTYQSQVKNGATQTVFEKVENKSNAQAPGTDKSTPEAQAAARKHIEQTLGTTVKASFAKHLKDAQGNAISGEWTPGETMNAIRVALNASDVLGTTFHESFHEFVSVLRKHGGADTLATLQKIADSGIVRQRLELLLNDHPDAIKQLDDADERLAYMYQFWMSGDLKLGPQGETLFAKIKRVLTELFDKAAKIYNKDAVHAEEIMKLFTAGAVRDNSVTEPVLKPGMIRLYRGEGGQLTNSVKGGDWFTTSREHAAKFGELSYVDVTEAELGKQFAHGHAFKKGVREEYVMGSNQEIRNRVSKLNPSYAQAASVKKINESTEKHNQAIKNIGDAYRTFARTAGRVIFSTEAMMEATNNEHMISIARDFNQKSGTAMGEKQAFFDAVAQKTAMYHNKLANLIDGYSKEEIEAARKALATQKTPNAPRVKAIFDGILNLNKEMYEYIDKMDIRRLDEDHKWVKVKARKDFFMPRVYDNAAIEKDTQGFRNLLLEKHADELAKIAAEANKEIELANQTGDFSKLKGAAAVERDKARAEFEASGKIMAKSNIAKVTPEGVADAIMGRIMRSGGDVEIGETTSSLGMTPLAASVNKRELNWLDKEAFDKYLSQDLIGIYSNYISSIVKRGEYTQAFGHGGEKIRNKADKALLQEMGGKDLVKRAEIGIEAEIKAWAAARREAMKNKEEFNEPFPTLRSVGIKFHQIQHGAEKALADLNTGTAVLAQAMRSVQAMEGTLGDDITQGMRDINSTLVTYQNIRLLPLTLFTSFSDVMGVVANGGTVKDAFNAFVRGIREIKGSWTGNLSKDEQAQRAELWGTVDKSALLDAIGQTYGSAYMSSGARKLSDKFFRINGMEGWNRGMRIAATTFAEDMILGMRKLDRNDKAAVARFERLFGAGADSTKIAVDKDGKLDVTNAANQMAIARAVNDMVLRPNASQRTIWGSDPHWAAVWHLKQFTYTFQKVMVEGALAQAKLGNYRPAAVLVAGYVPMMIAAGAAKELLIPGEEPPWMQGGLDDVLAYGIGRAGFGGVPQMYGSNLGSTGFMGVFGPTVGQVTDAVFRDDTLFETGAAALPAGSVLRRVAN